MSCSYCAFQHAKELELMADEDKQLIIDRGTYRPPVTLEPPQNDIVIQEQTFSSPTGDQNV